MSFPRGGVSQASRWRVRPAVAAFPFVVLAAVLLRQLFVGVGADEFSLLRMGQVLRDGSFPYAEYWDVRPPLAYLIALPSAFADDATGAVALLRMLAWLAQALAAYLFFCLFQRGIGPLAAAVGAIALLATANATDLHASALPNHFVMALAVLAFAFLVAGLRGRRGAYLLSALVAGMLPWVMVHAAVVAGSLGIMALIGGALRPARRLAWLLAAIAPSLVVSAAYWCWGPFDVFARTVFAAPFAVAEMRGGGYHFFSAAALWRLLADAPWAVLHVAVLAVGAACLPTACRAAGAGSALRSAPFLAVPLAVGFGVMAYVKPPAPPEYWVEMAPVTGLLVAVAVAELLGVGVWDRIGGRRVSPGVLRVGVGGLAGLLLALPVDPWREARPPLPATYCKDAAARWLTRLRAEDTVLDFTGICGYHVLELGARSHPPFTFPPMWLRMLDQPWIGNTLAGDGSAAAAEARLRAALGLSASPAALERSAAAERSAAVLVLADNRLLRHIRTRGWMQELHRQWRVAWFHQPQSLERSAPTTRETTREEAPFASLAILVRRDWEREVTGQSP